MTKAIEWLDAHGGIVLAGLALFYAVLGLWVLNPQVFYSGDIGVKYVQAMALADHRFTSLDIPYPAEFLDPGREFFPDAAALRHGDRRVDAGDFFTGLGGAAGRGGRASPASPASSSSRLPAAR